MKYAGILRIGYKLLVNDRAKFSALLIGVTFAVFLMTQMTALFAGILNRAYANVTNIGAPMWIMDPAVNNASSSIPVPDYLLDAVRSMEGVRYAVPLFIGGAQVRLDNGLYQSATVIGLDDTSLYGRPELEQGRIEDIYADNAFLVVHDLEYAKLLNPAIGAAFELNDHRAVVVGIARVVSSGLNGVPTLYTTYRRAIEYLPTTRYTMSYVLLAPKDATAIPGIKRQVERLGYVAMTKDDFNRHITVFYIFQTGIGTNILLMTLISFIVGLSISGQTFYAFILENMEKFAALKAIGAKSRELVYMILFMATFTALTGFGLGIGLVTAVIGITRYKVPNYAAMITWWNLLLAFCMVVLIGGISSYIGVRKVLRIEPFDIFRG